MSAEGLIVILLSAIFLLLFAVFLQLVWLRDDLMNIYEEQRRKGRL